VQGLAGHGSSSSNSNSNSSNNSSSSSNNHPTHSKHRDNQALEDLLDSFRVFLHPISLAPHPHHLHLPQIHNSNTHSNSSLVGCPRHHLVLLDLQVVLKEAQVVPMEAQVVHMEAQVVPMEAQVVPMAPRMVPHHK